MNREKRKGSKQNERTKKARRTEMRKKKKREEKKNRHVIQVAGVRALLILKFCASAWISTLVQQVQARIYISDFMFLSYKVFYRYDFD